MNFCMQTLFALKLVTIKVNFHNGDKDIEFQGKSLEVKRGFGSVPCYWTSYGILQIVWSIYLKLKSKEGGTVFKIVLRFFKHIKFMSNILIMVNSVNVAKIFDLTYNCLNGLWEKDSAIFEHLRKEVTHRNFSGIRCITTSNTLVMFLLQNFDFNNWFYKKRLCFCLN